MSKYSASYRLKSCDVNKSLVKNIEKFVQLKTKESFEHYLKNREESKLSFSEGKLTFEKWFKESFSISIKDKIGTEVINSIDEYQREKFPDNIESLGISFHSYLSIPINLEIEFSAEYYYKSKLNISTSLVNSKEFTKTFFDGIREVVEERRNFNFILHNRGIQSILIAISAFSLNVVIFLYPKLNEGQFYSFVGLLVLAPFLLLSTLFKTYAFFDTKRNESIKRFYVWFFYALLAFVIFNVIFVLLRNKLLGF